MELEDKSEQGFNWNDLERRYAGFIIILILIGIW